MAIPASDMIFELSPIMYMGMNERRTDTGIVTIGTKAEGMCHKNRRMTELTMIISRISSCLSVAIDRSINSDLS